MPDATGHSVTQLLGDLRDGRRSAFDELFPLVYDELRALAHGQRRKWKGNETLNTTALVHEAYLKLVREHDPTWETESHFLATATTAIRQILINYARDRSAKKRGGEWNRESLRDVDEAAVPHPADDWDERVVALDEALHRLAKRSERQSRIVECRFFGGMTIKQTAEALGFVDRNGDSRLGPRRGLVISRAGPWASSGRGRFGSGGGSVIGEKQWEWLEAAFTKGRGIPQSEREAWLERACSNHPELKDELVALLAASDESPGFLGDLAEDLVGPDLRRLLRDVSDDSTGSRDPRIGRTVGHYEILARMGAGGMGVVYRARDVKLDRVVALKFLPVDQSGAGDARRRLLNEARAASALDHPNICTIHEVGETEDGHLFIAMACYDGRTLANRILSWPIAPSGAPRRSGSALTTTWPGYIRPKGTRLSRWSGTAGSSRSGTRRIRIFPRCSMLESRFPCSRPPAAEGQASSRTIE